MSSSRYPAGSSSSGGSGDVTGPASSTDNAITRFNGTGGKTIQNSSASLDDSGIITAAGFVGPVTGNVTGNITGNITGNVTGNVSGSAGSLSSVNPVAKGGTNSSVALNNNRVMKSSGGAIVEAAAITANKALVSDADGIPTASATSDTQIGYLSTLASDVQVQVTARLPLSGGTMTGAIVLAADPTVALNPATKQYVDSLVQGLNVKPAVLCATTANITLSGEQTLDGVLTSASRVLVKNQSAPAENGIYVSAAGAWARATDMDSWAEVPGAFCFIEEGTLYADTAFVSTADPGGTLGTTAITWSQFAGSGTYSAGQGLTLTGSVFSFTALTASRLVVTDGSGNPIASAVTATEAGYLAGASSSIQTQLNTKVTSGGALGTPSSGDASNLTGLPTAGLVDNAVTNAKAAQVATATFKGRTTAGTGNVEDLTATQATALLNAMVGDSGSGGTKGLVPAPASGDAAAGKFFKADGSWAAPAGASLPGYTTTATAGGTTSLTSSSTFYQKFTGTSGQDCKLPDTSTLSVGNSFCVINDSSGTTSSSNVTVHSSTNANLLRSSLTPGECCTYVCISTSVNTSAAWLCVNYGRAQPGTNTNVAPIPFTGANVWYDTNKNIFANNFGYDITSVATAAGTTTMSSSDTRTRRFTGSSTQTVKLPSTASTDIRVGYVYEIINESTGDLTIQTSTASALCTMPVNTTGKFVINSVANNNAASWSYTLTPNRNVNGQYVGVSSNTVASTGNLGEVLPASGSQAFSAVAAAATTAYAQLASVPLTKGNWEGHGLAMLVADGTSVFSGNQVALFSTTTASAAGSTDGLDRTDIYSGLSTPGNGAVVVAIPVFIHLSLSADTTYYFNAAATYSAGAPTWTGHIRFNRTN